jgi:outer membrane receptor protein involved in Fe transport
MGACGILLCGASFAETSPPPAAQNAAAPEGLEEIIVTGRKRAESLQEIPVAVSAISADQIQRQDLTSLEKIAATTPQLTVGRASSGSGAQISMRGIGSNSTSIGIDQSVATVIDGAYSGVGRVIYEGFFDLDGVEILKGPQALFFGKNATAGVISLKTKDPGDHEEGLVRGSYEFYSQTGTMEAVYSTPITDTLGVRVAIRGSKMWGGYYDNYSPVINYATTDLVSGATTNHSASEAASKMPGEKEGLGRITIKWKPNNDLTATLKLNIDNNDVNDNSWNYMSYACANGFSTLSPTVRCTNDNFVVHQNNLPAAIASATQFAGDGNLYNHFNSYNGIGTINYNMSKASLDSVFFYDRNSNGWLCNCAYQTGPIWADEHSTWRAFSNETRLSTHLDLPVNFLLGSYFQSTQRNFDQNVLFAGAQNTAAPPGYEYVAYAKDSKTRGKTYSLFGQATWKFLNDLELAGGVRYIDEQKNSYFVQPYVNPSLTSLFVPDTFVRADQTFINFSPEATISYHATQNINMYAAYKTAYKSGGLSNSGIYSALSKAPYDDFTFDPEKASGFEVGLKTVLFDNQLRFNTTVYRYRYTNLQVDFFNSPTFAFLTINAGAAISRGIEEEFEYAPHWLPGVTFNASVNYNDSRYKNFIGPCYSGQSVQNGCPLPTGPGGFPQQDLSGAPTSVAPKWTATLGGYYERPLTGSLDIGLGADARFSSDYLASPLGNQLSRVGSYTTMEASVRVKTQDKKWEAALLGKNLTNRQYYLGAQDAPATGSGTGTVNGISADQSGYGTLPRQLSIEATYRF